MRSCCRKMKGCTKQCGRFNSRFVFSLLSEGVERVFFFFESQHGLWIAEVFCLWCIQERERGTANSGTDETGSADSKEGVMKADTLNGGGDGGGRGGSGGGGGGRGSGGGGGGGGGGGSKNNKEGLENGGQGDATKENGKTQAGNGYQV